VQDASLDKRARWLNNWMSQVTVGDGTELAKPSEPIIFVVGVQRSGTTLTMQLLANHFEVTYPDNLIARFWEMPHAGIIASRTARELMGQNAQSNWDSSLGRTQGIFEPHEFGYFWTKWFQWESCHELTDAELARVDRPGLLNVLGLMEKAGGSPLLFKGASLAMNASWLAEHFPMAHFVYLHRDPLYVIQSTYKGRIQEHGNADLWWSLKPRNYEALMKLPALHQIAAQVLLCRTRIDDQLKRVPANRIVHMRYEELCEKPHTLLSLVSEMIPQLRSKSTDPPTLSCRNTRQVDPPLFQQLEEALAWATKEYSQ